MTKYLVIIFACLLIILFVNFRSGWKVVTVLPEMHKAKALWFNGNIGLVAGSYMSVDDWVKNENINEKMNKLRSFVLTTKDGGANWENQYLGNGEIQSISANKSNMKYYMLLNEYMKDGAVLSSVYKSNNELAYWNKIFIYKNKMNGIDFSNDNCLLVWSENNVYFSRDKGCNWEIIETKSAANPVVNNDCSIWIAVDKNIRAYNSNKLIVDTQLNFTPTILTHDDVGRLYVIGVDNDKLILTTFDNKMQTNTLYTKYGYNPIALNVSEDTIVFLASTIIGSSRDIYLGYSIDCGKNWKFRRANIDHSKPIFIDGRRVWVYCSHDELKLNVIKER